MLALLDGKYFAAEVTMLLASPSVNACVLQLPGSVGFSHARMPSIVFDDRRHLDECIGSLGGSPVLHLRDASLLAPRDLGSCIAYIDRRSGPREEQKEQFLTAREFVASKIPIRHLTISKMDVSANDLALAMAASRLRSLDLSRLELEDQTVVGMVRS